jgi:hypothetical protein
MTEKKYHKGWLYERDGVKFSPYTLVESIVDRNGVKWTEQTDNSLQALTEAIVVLNDTVIPGLGNEISATQDRVLTLEARTQYLDATASDVFYITDQNGNIALKVDGNGATSFNFISPETDLNALAQKASGME